MGVLCRNNGKGEKGDATTLEMEVLNQAKLVLAYFSMILLPLLWPPMYIYKCTVIVIARIFYPEYGRIFSCADLLMEEDLAGGRRPKSSLLCSMELEGDMELEELRELFSENVLGAEIVRNSFIWKAARWEETYSTRYPELKQCPASFMGYTFWRDVEAFSLKDHIYEMETPSNLSLLHENVLNMPYSPNKSLWDLILIRNFQEVDLMENISLEETRTVIIARFHHSMSDAKSIMKLIVECLGQQPLNTAQPQPETVQNPVGFILSYPFYFARNVLALSGPINQCWNHNWKNKSKADFPQIVRLSPKLSLDDVKRVGKKWKGATSSVILAVICGAMREVDSEISRVISAYIINYQKNLNSLRIFVIIFKRSTFGALELPTDMHSPLERLQTCSKIFRELKESEMNKYFEFPTTLIGAEFNPIRKCHVEVAATLFGVPVGITNIAGERNGFSVGKCGCSEVIYSVGTMDSSVGVVFCISSYKDHCRIAVISSGGVLAPSQVEQLASGMLNELEILKQL